MKSLFVGAVMIAANFATPAMAQESSCKSGSVWEAIPVLMLTARKGEADVVNALRSGASDYMTKPFIPQELAARVDLLLATSGYVPEFR